MLLQDANPQQLSLAAAVNHSVLFRQEAVTIGGKCFSAGGLSWTSGNGSFPSMIAFPVLSPEDAGQRLDELIDFYLRHPPKGAGCWSLDPPEPPDLGVRLLARGFQPGWRPRWMALDLGEARTGHPLPRGLTITTDNGSSLEGITQLPYAQVIIPTISLAEMPGQWMRFVARLRGKVVAQSVVFLSGGPHGAAGIYHVGVVPRVRHLGIGKAVTLAACRYAQERGYRYAVLNSTDAGRRTYEQLGFVTVGEGWTWWLITDRLLAHPPSSMETALAEAVGRSDMAALEGFSRSPDVLNRPLTNGMTLMQLAVHFQQPASAEWLVEGGAAYNVLDAWDLGWKDRARGLLDENADAVNYLYGEMQNTLLHVAAERGDEDLAGLALAAGPDLKVKDKRYQSTALEWARHFGRIGIIRLIEIYRG
jgi:ribosomal protein S18 acetylase RimI-like enzyme